MIPWKIPFAKYLLNKFQYKKNNKKMLGVLAKLIGLGFK